MIPGGWEKRRDAGASEATDAELLAPLRLTMVRVALTLGWLSAGVVLVGSLSPSWHADPIDHVLILALVGAAAAVNGVLGLLPWRRWVGTGPAELVFTTWAAAVVVLISIFVHLGGAWSGSYYLLYFLVVPFIAATEPLIRQIVLYAMALAGYLVASLLTAGPHPAGPVMVRLLVLGGACVVGGTLAQGVAHATRARARAEAAARLERLLADEAHHRIKNNLQLIADLLSMEASKAGSELVDVVEETLSRIQSVAAVHQALATGGEGRVALRPVVDRIVGLLADRIGGERLVTVEGGEGVDVAGRRATWTALVVNELVTNALRHGRGRVRVTLDGGPEEVALGIGDEGPGPGAAPPGLGLALVERILRDGLGGRLESRAGSAGWETVVAFPREWSEELAGAGAHR